jgi:hypothetical protein
MRSASDSRDNRPMAERNDSKGLAAVLPYTTVLLIVAVIYVGYTLYSRRRDAKAAAEQAAAKEAAQNQKIVDQYGGTNTLKLLNFSISPIRLHRGEAAHLCYGVSNADSVTIEPHVEDTKPSYNHCLDISPTKDTTYTLTAKDKAGHTETGSLTVKVQ